MSLGLLWSRPSIAALVGLMLLMVPIFADTEGGGTSRTDMLPRGRGFDERKTVELLVSRLEQDICAGRKGEVRALLGTDLRRELGTVLENMLSVTSSGPDPKATRRYVDISPECISLRGDAATVTYRLRICFKDEEGHFQEIANSVGTLRLSRHVGGWRVAQCDHLMESLSTATSPREKGQRE